MAELKLWLEDGDRSLSVRTVRVAESLSDLFVVDVWARTPNAELAIHDMIGRGAALRIAAGLLHGKSGSRIWSGVIRSLTQTQAEPTGLSTYHMTIVPKLWLLTQRTNHRVHQYRSVPDIVDSLLDGWGVERVWRVDRDRYPKFEYRVQYAETDYAFLCRLLEEAGIAFSFAAEGPDEPSRLELDDALHVRPARSPGLPFVDSPNRSAEREFVTGLRLLEEIRPTSYLVRDHDFRRPDYALFGGAKAGDGDDLRLELYSYEPGAFLAEARAERDTPAADDRGTSRHREDHGSRRSEVALGAAREGRRALAFESNAYDLSPGATIDVTDHPHPTVSGARPWLVTNLSLDAAVDGEWTMRGRAVDTDAAYRPAQNTKRPHVGGVQTATVVGPSGDEIHTDEFGRVRVQFPWDRDGSSNEQSSPWVRVSEAWAGASYGSVMLPRVGQEVLVAFFGGNPDQPVVVGRVFNATQMVPYKLPDNKTRSTWKSRSTPDADGSNELMFEDDKGHELVWIQAERDLRRLVKHDETVTIGNDLSRYVKGNELETTGGNRTELTNLTRTEITDGARTTVIGMDEATSIGGTRQERVARDSLTWIGGDEHVIVEQERRERIGQNSDLRVGGGHNLAVGSYSLSCGSLQIGIAKDGAIEAGEQIHLKAGTELVIEAQAITMKGPGGFVTVDDTGVTISGALVRINSGGAALVGKGAHPAGPEPPKVAYVEDPARPAADDVSITRFGA